MMFPRVTVLLACLAVWAAPTQASKAKEIDRELQGHDRELKEIQKKIEEGRRKLDHLKREERDVMKKLDQIDDNLDLALRYLRTLDDKEKGLSQQIFLLENRMIELQDELAARNEQMKLRLRRIYKQGKQGFLDAFLGAQSLTQGFERMHFFQSLNSYDRNLIVILGRTRESVKEQKSELEAKLVEIQGVQREKERHRESLLGQRKEKFLVLGAIESKKSNYEQMVKELKASQKAITNLIALLQSRKQKELHTQKPGTPRVRPEPGKLKGKLVWPASGTVARRFGKYTHPKYKTTTLNLGIDIKAESGEPVRAITEGTVVYVGRMRGYGNLLIVEHEESFYSLYAHLNEIAAKADQKVQAGEIIGRVGDTGSFEGSKLHFELRREKEVVNPEEYLP